MPNKSTPDFSKFIIHDINLRINKIVWKKIKFNFLWKKIYMNRHTKEIYSSL